VTDPYTVLGLTYGATEQEVQAAYRKLAMQYHPDRNGGDRSAEERFKDINAAHDRIKAGYVPPASRPRPPGPDEHAPWRRGTPYGRRDTDEMLRAFRAHSSGRNRDIDMSYTVTLEDALVGRVATLTLRLPTGPQDVRILIPKGVETGHRIRIPGAGENIWPSCKPGDLVVTIIVAPHGRFGRVGAELHSTLPVDVVDMILGCDIVVTTIDGQQLKVVVPPYSKNGLMMRIPGHGMPLRSTEDKRGDLILVLEAKMPQTLTAEQKALLEKFRLLDSQSKVE